MGVDWGRNSAILQSIIDGTEYTDPPQSHIEELLIELKQIIEAGGGSTENYEGLSGKPAINNHTLQSGNNTYADLGIQPTLTFDSAPTENSDNPVKSGGVYTALGGKQDTLTFDSSPTDNSNNPVKSGGVYTAVKNVNDKLYSTIAGISQNAKGSMALDSTVDLDNILVSGFYAVNSSTHSPFTTAALIVCGIDANNCFQQIADIATGAVKTRVCTAGTWGSWSETNNIIHA